MINLPTWVVFLRNAAGIVWGVEKFAGLAWTLADNHLRL